MKKIKDRVVLQKNEGDAGWVIQGIINDDEFLDGLFQRLNNIAHLTDWKRTVAERKWLSEEEKKIIYIRIDEKIKEAKAFVKSGIKLYSITNK